MTNILIIEDDPEAAHILELSLKREQYQITITLNGMQGLASVQAAQPDIVLLDLMLPDIDGYEILRRIRANPLTAKLAIVVVSARAQDADKIRAAQLGANGYLTKPYRRADLLNMIQACLPKPTQSAA